VKRWIKTHPHFCLFILVIILLEALRLGGLLLFSPLIFLLLGRFEFFPSPADGISTQVEEFRREHTGPGPLMAFYFLMVISVMALRWNFLSEFSLSPVSLGLLREYLAGLLYEYYPRDNANLLRALLLGERGLNPEAEGVLRRAGAGHLLALSGLHVGYISLFLNFFFGRAANLSGLRFIRYLSLPLLAGYIMLAGSSPSLLRAGIMCIGWILLSSRRKNTSLLNMLGLAGIIILFIDPGHLQMMSFQLSFMVVLSLIIYLPILRGLLPLPLAISLAAQIGSIPLLLQLTGSLNLNGLVANLILIPLLGPIIFINIMFLITAPLSPTLAGVLSAAGNFLISPFLFLAGFLAGLPFIYESSIFAAENSGFDGEFFMDGPLMAFYLLLFTAPYIRRKPYVFWLDKSGRRGYNFRCLLWILLMFYFIYNVISVYS